MKPAPFDYLRPPTMEDALTALAELGEDAQPIAGGQSLVAMQALRVSRPAVLVDIGRIDGLAGIERERNGIRIGATTRQNALLSDPVIASDLPALAKAARMIGHHQTRNRGTVGGSVALADPASELPAFMLAMGATIVLASASGQREVAANDFFEGPYMTARRADELIVSLFVPLGRDTRVAVGEIARRPGDFAMTGVVVRLDMARSLGRDRIEAAGFGWFGMGPAPMRAPTAEAALAGAKPGAVDIAAVAAMAVGDCDPVDDVHATRAYRIDAGTELVTRVLARALNGENG